MLGVGLVAAAASGGRIFPVTPVLTHHTTTGQFRITNFSSYPAGTTFNVSVTAGTATVSSDIITLSNANSVATVTAVGGGKAVSASGEATAERKAYTYSTVTTCTDNCASAYFWPGGNCPGPNCCNSFNNCWGGGVDGNCAADGTICCGGSRGQSCSSSNVKNSTPAGYTDSFGEWWKVA